MKYRHKPTVIDAIHYEGDNASQVLTFLLDGHADYSHLPTYSLSGRHQVGMSMSDGTIKIPTLEGVMLCRIGDWVVKGTHGEFYPVKDSVFQATYEEVPIYEAEVVDNNKQLCAEVSA